MGTVSMIPNLPFSDNDWGAQPVADFLPKLTNVAKSLGQSKIVLHQDWTEHNGVVRRVISVGNKTYATTEVGLSDFNRNRALLVSLREQPIGTTLLYGGAFERSPFQYKLESGYLQQFFGTDKKVPCRRSTFKGPFRVIITEAFDPEYAWHLVV